jgi:hypothetical protein
MGFAAATTAGLIVWLVLWATGQKAVDAFLVTVVIVLVAATVRMVARRFASDPET